MMAVAIVFSVIRLIKRYNDLNFLQQVIVVVFLCSMFTGCVMFNLTRGYDTCTQYWSPLVAFTFLILQIEISTEKYSFKNTKVFIVSALVFSILFTSVASVKQFQKTPIHANPQLVNIANLIEGADRYFLQTYKETENVLSYGNSAPESAVMADFAQIAAKKVKFVKVR